MSLVRSAVPKSSCNEESDLPSITQVQQQIWSKGDFARVAPIVQVVADRLVESVNVLPDDRVLDVACGSGNTAIAAARTFAEVTGIDFVPALLDRARAREAAELLDVEFVAGDCLLSTSETRDRLLLPQLGLKMWLLAMLRIAPPSLLQVPGQTRT
jgi:2-polyprenyl-3-methyl-5-hydroxy-6-metoxy-1,4-benzoquinol methylase